MFSSISNLQGMQVLAFTSVCSFCTASRGEIQTCFVTISQLRESKLNKDEYCLFFSPGLQHMLSVCFGNLSCLQLKLAMVAHQWANFYLVVGVDPVYYCMCANVVCRFWWTTGILRETCQHLFVTYKVTMCLNPWSESQKRD